MLTAKVSTKGWVVLPVEYRRKYHITPGQVLRIVDYGGLLGVVPAEADPIRAGLGLLKGRTSLTRALLEERRRDKKREQRH